MVLGVPIKNGSLNVREFKKKKKNLHVGTPEDYG